MQKHAAVLIKLFLILAIIIANLGVEADPPCKESDGSSCVTDDECCTKICYKNFGWHYGFCRKNMDLKPTTPGAIVPKVEKGMCAFTGGKRYGAHKNLTANGETYDRNQLTAGHRTLPFNTLVRVDVMGNSVIVRINNRCAGKPGQILEMAPHAAEIMGVNPLAPMICQLTLSSDIPICKSNFGLPCRMHHECCSRNCFRKIFAERGFCSPPY